MASPLSTFAPSAWPMTTTRSHGVAQLSPSPPLPQPDHSSIRERIITPYSPDGFDFFLDKHNISHLHSDLVQKLHNSFPMGDFPPLQRTVIFPNRTSSPEHKAFIDNYLQEEAEVGRMSGPISRSEVKTILRPFQCSPLSVNVQGQAPEEEPKLHVVRNLSKGTKDIPSTNDYIDTENFPTRFSSAAQVADIVSWSSSPSYISTFQYIRTS